MDIDYLLFILPIIILTGVAGLILVIWQYGNPRQRTASEQIAPTDSRIRSNMAASHSSAVVVANPAHLASSNESAFAISKQKWSTNHKETLIILQLIATEDRPYQGYELIQTLSSAGFHYGEMNIFHYHAPQDEKNRRLFSLASAFEPGTFDLTHIGEIQCTGLCLFMSLSEVGRALNIFELMLETAQLLIQDLGGTLCDQWREPLTDNILTHYRSQLYAHA